MRLYNVHTLKEAQEVMERHFQFETERVHLDDAYGRILAETITADIHVPMFRRSTVDGYAVRTFDVSGASETMPILLDIIGSVDMGKFPEHALKENQSMYVPTGGMLPEGADGMVMVEYTELFLDQIGILKPAIIKEHIIDIGDDVMQGERVLEKHQLLSARHIGVLAAIGQFEVLVFKKLKATVISTGDELITTSSLLKRGEVYDINTHTLKHHLKHFDIEVVQTHVLKDVKPLIKKTIEHALECSDIVLISGGSSVGEKDYTADIIDELSKEEGVLIHGLAIKPGKPTIVGKVQNKLVLGLPGHPVSALIVMDQMMRMYLNAMIEMKPHEVRGTLTMNVHAAPGKETFVMVKVIDQKIYPIQGKSSMITMMSQADGYIRIGENQEGLNKDDQVIVYLLD